MSLREDVSAAYRRDPALRPGQGSQALMYQGVWAIVAHRLAHRLWRRGHCFAGRAVSQLSRFLTDIEIHPGATIGRRCFIDHGAGVVIGETAVIGDDVTLYHGVTLGGRGWWVDVKGAKRHPTIGDGVTLAVGATVLGPVTVGAGSRIGPYAVVMSDVAPGSVATAAEPRVGRIRRPPAADPQPLLPTDTEDREDRQA